MLNTFLSFPDTPKPRNDSGFSSEQFWTYSSLIIFGLDQPYRSYLASVLHQRFERFIYMIEIPLRSMINYAVWTPHIWALCSHDYHHSWTIKRRVVFPFVSRYQIRPRSDRRYLHTVFQPCYRRTLFTRSVSLRPRDPVTHLQGYGHNST